MKRIFLFIPLLLFVCKLYGQDHNLHIVGRVAPTLGFFNQGFSKGGEVEIYVHSQWILAGAGFTGMNQVNGNSDLYQNLLNPVSPSESFRSFYLFCGPRLQRESLFFESRIGYGQADLDLWSAQVIEQKGNATTIQWTDSSGIVWMVIGQIRMGAEIFKWLQISAGYTVQFGADLNVSRLDLGIGFQL